MPVVLPEPVAGYHTTIVGSSKHGASIVSIKDQLVALYHLNDNAYDSSIFQNNGTPTAITYGAGKFGNAAIFDGSTSVILAPDQSQIRNIFHKGGTWAAWIYVDSDGGSDVGRIGCKGNNMIGWITRNESGGQVGLRFYHYWSGNDGVWDTTNRVVNNGEWTHVAISYDGSNSSNVPKMYVNGVHITDITAVTSPSGSIDDDSTGGLRIGNNTGAAGFDGMIDEFAVWRRVLSDAEVEALANATSPISDLFEGEMSFKGVNQFRVDLLNKGDIVKITATDNTKYFVEANFDYYVSRANAGGGYTGSAVNTIDTFNLIVLDGNAIDKGDLTLARSGAPCGAYNGVYSFWASGHTGVASNIIDYVAKEVLIQNAIDKGDLAVATYHAGAVHTFYNAFVMGGSGVGSGDEIQYYDLVSLSSNGVDGGDLTLNRAGCKGIQSPTHGFCTGGTSGGAVNVIDYFSFVNKTMDALDKGDLVTARYYHGETGQQWYNAYAYGFVAGGTGNLSSIEYIDMTTLTGNAVAGGSLTVGRTSIGGIESETHGFFLGGEVAGYSTVIDYITFTTITGNATDRDDLTVGRRDIGGA